MSVTVVGSVAFDSLETPFGKRERILGGAATHFSVSASYFTDVRVVGVVGDDFGEQEYAVFEARGIDTTDLERVEGGRSFHWSGRYEEDMAVAHTLATDLNVFADFDPKLSPESQAARILFLANIQPDLQRQVRAQCRDARFAGLDSMNYWIDSARESLGKAISEVDCVVLNDTEVRMLTDEPNLARAARELMSMGPRVVLVKQGAYGACMYTADGFFSVPAYPLETVFDPTGAGDAFAGGFFGYLDLATGDEPSEADLRTACVAGSVMASFIVEEFGNERLQRLTEDEIAARFEEFRQMTVFEVPSTLPRLLTTRSAGDGST
jgi:sugar/nucleoside kinase (ribokinase family)